MTRWLVAIVLLLAPTAERTSQRGTGAEPEVVLRIESILTDTALTGGIQGVIIQSLKDGRVWYERNPDLYFMPASNQKLLTSSAALHLLGPDWKYRTRLLADGEIDGNGALTGSLYLEGGGDPTLLESHLDRFVHAVRGVGIRRIRGNIVGDDDGFDAQRYGPGWSWDYLQDYYAAPVSALNLNRNVVTIHVEPGKELGDRAVVAMKPIPLFFVDNRVFTTDGESEFTVRREPGLDRLEAKGTVSKTGPREDRTGIRITVLDPAQFAAAVLKEKLVQAGVIVDGEAIRGRTPESKADEIATHESAPLSEILKVLNKPSDNLIAECLLKMLGASTATGWGSFAGGRWAAMAWFNEIGIPRGGFDMADGSGLSRLNVVTPRSLAKLLEVMHSHPQSKVFRDSLPIAGVDGTLRNRMKGTPAEGNCRAKSGFIGAVSSLSGYVTTKDEEPLLFVILMNNHRSRNSEVTLLQNRIVEFLAGYQRK